jgi:hypothetical protein
MVGDTTDADGVNVAGADAVTTDMAMSLLAVGSTAVTASMEMAASTEVAVASMAAVASTAADMVADIAKAI